MLQGYGQQTGGRPMPGNTLNDILTWLQSQNLDQWKHVLLNWAIFIIFVVTLIQFVVFKIRNHR